MARTAPLNTVGHWMCRLLLAAVFVYAGLAKSGDVLSFANAIAAFDILPRQLVLPVAAYLPWLEVTAGAGMLLPFSWRGAILVLSGLMLAFSAVLIVAMARGLDITCGCFGSNNPAPAMWALLRNVALLAVCAAAVVLSARRQRVQTSNVLVEYPLGDSSTGTTDAA